MIYIRNDELKTAIAQLGGDNKSLYRIKRVFREMRKLGRAKAGELLLFSEAGFPVWNYLAQARGAHPADAMRLVEAGRISSDEAIAAICGGIRRDYLPLWMRMGV